MDKHERTNAYKGEFSPTGIEDAFCLRKFYYRKVLGLKPNRPAIALDFGASIHKGVEAFYQNKVELGHEEATVLAVESFAKAWLDCGIEGDAKRNLTSGIICMERYGVYYKDDSAILNPQFIESQQWVEMPNGTHMLFKIDRVRTETGENIIVDTKTSSWALTDFFFQSFENNFQTSMYLHGVNTIMEGGCDKIQIDGIKVPPPPEKGATIPFARRTFTRTELQVADALNTWCRVTDYIVGTLAKYKEDEEALCAAMYCNQTKCKEYSGCEYLPICKYGFKHPSVQVEFIREEITKGEHSE